MAVWKGLVALQLNKDLDDCYKLEMDKPVSFCTVMIISRPPTWRCMAYGDHVFWKSPAEYHIMILAFWNNLAQIREENDLYNV